MTEYGVLLHDGIVAAAASHHLAIDYAAATDRELCARTHPDAEWSVITPPAPGVPANCAIPTRASARRHRAHGERPCPPCAAAEARHVRAQRDRAKERAA